MTQTNDTPMRDASRDGCGACLVCGAALTSARARYCSRAHQQRAFRLRHQPSLPDLQRLRQELQRRRAVVARRGLSTSAPAAVNASSASAAARTAASFLAPSVWAVTARNATRPCCWSICSERRWSGLAESSTAARQWAWTRRSARAELG